MAIARVVMVDDDGSEETGTPVDSEFINGVYDSIEEAVPMKTDFAWSAYTCAWTGVSTNPVIGNGTISGRKCQVGKMVWYAIRVSIGSTTTFGSGAYRFSLPTAASGSAIHVGVARLFDSGTNVRMALAIPASSTTVAVFQDTNAASGITPTSPFTFASGDAIEIQGCYEAA